MESLQELVPPDQKPGIIDTDDSLDFMKTCVGITSSQLHTDQKPAELPKTPVRRVQEGTTAFLVYSGSSEKWWEAMECFCCLRHITARQTGRRTVTV